MERLKDMYYEAHLQVLVNYHAEGDDPLARN
jgi:hypothetical protein